MAQFSFYILTGRRRDTGILVTFFLRLFSTPHGHKEVKILELVVLKIDFPLDQKFPSGEISASRIIEEKKNENFPHAPAG